MSGKGAVRAVRSFWAALGRARNAVPIAPLPRLGAPKIGLALGGGFARGIAHVGVLKVFQQHQVPIHCITGVSAGAIVASAFASGATPAEIAAAACSLRFADVARWSLGRMGFVASERMKRFLERLLKNYRFEEMPVKLGILATDVVSGESVRFSGSGDVFFPIRASCAYPGLFHPVHYNGRVLVDGAISMEIPARLAHDLGATHVISIHLPIQGPGMPPKNMFQVVNRCFQILQRRTEQSWREASDLVIEPDVRGVEWDGFACAPQLLQAGEDAALAALPEMQKWFPQPQPAAAALMPGSELA